MSSMVFGSAATILPRSPSAFVCCCPIDKGRLHGLSQDETSGVDHVAGSPREGKIRYARKASLDIPGRGKANLACSSHMTIVLGYLAT